MSLIAEMTSKLDELARRELRDWVEELAVLHALQVQAQALLDMVMRVAAELGYTPLTPREAARALVGEGLLSEDEYQLIRRVAGFRNIVVHEYATVDMELVRKIVKQGEYRRVATLAAKLLEAASKRGVDV
jgi:uncharacterized protein YutE (UPF0331/DUF86 family)